MGLSKVFDDHVDDHSEKDNMSLENMVYSDDESSIEDQDLDEVDSYSSEVCQVAILERIRQFSQILFPRRDMMQIGDYKYRQKQREDISTLTSDLKVYQIHSR